MRQVDLQLALDVGGLKFLSCSGEGERASSAPSLPWPSLLDCEPPPLPSPLSLREREPPLLLLPLRE